LSRSDQLTEVIKPLGVAVQNRVLVLVGKVLVLNDLCNFTFAIVVIYFVRKIRGTYYPPQTTIALP